MKDKIFEVLQRIGRSFMLPIAILPVAGLLLGLGSSFTNETTIATYHLGKILGDGTILHALLVMDLTMEEYVEFVNGLRIPRRLSLSIQYWRDWLKDMDTEKVFGESN